MGAPSTQAAQADQPCAEPNVTPVMQGEPVVGQPVAQPHYIMPQHPQHAQVTVYTTTYLEPEEPSCCWITGAVFTFIGLFALALMTVLFPSLSDYGPESDTREDWDGIVVLIALVYLLPPLVIVLIIGCVILTITRLSAPRKACKYLLITAAALTLTGATTGLVIFAIRSGSTNDRWTRINGGWQLVTGCVTGAVLIALAIMTTVYRCTEPQAGQPPHALQQQ